MAFNFHKPGLQKLLGELEAAIMEVLWADEAAITVRDVHDRLPGKRAYTTVMTVMSNLADKGLLVVDKEGVAHRYRPASSREAYTREHVGQIIDGLLSDFGDPAIAHFAESLNQAQLERFQQLAEEVARRRKEEA